MYTAEGYGTGLVPPPDWPLPDLAGAASTPATTTARPRPRRCKKLLDEAAKQKLPGVKVRIGRLSDFADAILAEKPELPVVRGDMPDTWIHGPMSDPAGAKLARNIRPAIAATECAQHRAARLGRVACRTRTATLADGLRAEPALRRAHLGRRILLDLRQVRLEVRRRVEEGARRGQVSAHRGLLGRTHRLHPDGARLDPAGARRRIAIAGPGGQGRRAVGSWFSTRCPGSAVGHGDDSQGQRSARSAHRRRHGQTNPD